MEETPQTIEGPTRMQKIKHFFAEYWRVLIVTKRPEKQEYFVILKVSLIGIAVIGVLGFIIQMLWQLLA